MRRFQRLLGLALTTSTLIAFGAGGADAHSGGSLDVDGCHRDRRTGGVHCHRGPAAGLAFPSTSAAQEAIRSGNLPEPPAPRENGLQRAWRRWTQDKAANGTGTPPVQASPAAGAVPATTPPAAVPSEAETPTAGAATSPAPATPASPAAVTRPPAVEEDVRDLRRRLEVLEGLRRDGVVTEQEYETRRAAILGEI